MKTFFMKKLTKFELTSEFEDNKDLLQTYEDYAALTEDERKVYFKEIPDMVDIALWDNTEEKLLMIRGYEYTAEQYPTNRYTPIGVEVIPKSHMDDGHARIMSLKIMNPNDPNKGAYLMNACFGMYNQEIEGIEYKYYVPYINEIGTENFGIYQEVKGFHFLDSNDSMSFFEIQYTIDYSDLIEINNPFTKNQGYSTIKEYYPNFVLAPSPYNKFMGKNPIFFTENSDISKQSILLDFDGKDKTNKILAQLNKNLGNEDWKTGDTIPNTTSETLGWDKIAPPAQCCWRYCVDEKYKDNPIFGQGQWYLPTVGEMCYIMARVVAINNTLERIFNITHDNDIHNLFIPGYSYWTHKFNSNLNLTVNLPSGQITDNSFQFHQSATIALCMI